MSPFLAKTTMNSPDRKHRWTSNMQCNATRSVSEHMFWSGLNIVPRKNTKEALLDKHVRPLKKSGAQKEQTKLRTLHLMQRVKSRDVTIATWGIRVHTQMMGLLMTIKTTTPMLCSPQVNNEVKNIAASAKETHTRVSVVSSCEKGTKEHVHVSAVRIFCVQRVLQHEMWNYMDLRIWLSSAFIEFSFSEKSCCVKNMGK